MATNNGHKYAGVENIVTLFIENTKAVEKILLTLWENFEEMTKDHQG